MSEGEFRGSGYFRVDRAKAVEKLSAFQLEQGEQFLLPLARCAAAAGAQVLEVRGVARLEARFTGTPFTREELADPYGALFVEDPDPRRHQLAVFLLGVLRTRPSEVAVASGNGVARFRVRVSGLDGETVEPDEHQDVGTTVRVSWGAIRGFKRIGAAKAAAREAWVMTPQGFKVDGARPWAMVSERRLLRNEERNGLKLRLEPPEGSVTSITFCSFGVAVETIETLLPEGQIRAWVNDDSFSLTTSQSAVVEDVRRQKALDAVGAAAANFLPEAARMFSAALPEGRAVSGAPAWAAEACAWFSDTMRRAAAEGRKAPDILWETPFLTDASGRALSPATLKSGLATGGQAAYSTFRSFGSRLPRPVAYCPDKGDRALLEALFPGSLLDATQLIESLTQLK